MRAPHQIGGGWPVALLLALLPACEPAASGGGMDETEIISRVTLRFSPDDGGPVVTARFDDPDGDGGQSGEAEAIVLAVGTDYSLEIELANGLVEPAVDQTAEVAGEAEHHQLFILGDAVAGPASASPNALLTHAYDDRESDYGVDVTGEDLVVGLRNAVATITTGAGQLRVMLRHLPPINGTPVKHADLAQDLRESAALPGDVDVDVSFALQVQ